MESAARRPHAGSLALVGPAGVGKTLLARGFVQQFADAHPDATVQWISATASASGIPFGAVSHLVEVLGSKNPTSVLRAAREALCPAGIEVLVAVDDAHLLDGYSAALVHQLVAIASATVVLTCRSGESVPDAITALWKDDFVTRVDVTPLSPGETTQLVEHALGGPLEHGSAERIFALSQGNPLYIRHLVEAATQHGNLRLTDGVWQLLGAMPLSRELADLIDLRLSALPETTQTVLQYLSVEQPLTTTTLAALVPSDAIEFAETAGVVEIEPRGHDFMVYPAHPLYTERLWQSLGQLAARRLRTDVVRELSSQHSTSVSDRLRLVTLAMDSELPPPVRDLISAAWEALYWSDLVLTERFARAALQRAEVVMARLVLAHALCWQGRGAEAEATLAALDPDAMSQFELLTWILARAGNQFWVLAQATEAMTWLDSMRSRLSNPDAQTVVDAFASQFAMCIGQTRQCLELASKVLVADHASDEAVGWATAAAALTYARIGNLEPVDELARRCLRAHCPDGVRYNAGLAQTQTAILQGNVDTAVDIAGQYLTSAGFRLPGRPNSQAILGSALIARGDLAGAVSNLRSAATYYDQTRDAWQSLNLSLLATALGQQGDALAAAEALRRAEGTHDMRTALHLPELHQGRAWTLAAARNMPGAMMAAREAIDEALRTGQFGQALLAYHDSVRLGDARRVSELTWLVSRFDSVAGPVVLAAARGLAAGDGAALQQAATEFERMGMFAAAADAAAQAATAYAARGRRSDELAACQHATRLRARCAGLTTPALETALSPLPLTGREKEIAVLVAAGESNKAIAERLSISIRTVEAHIYRACTKLDVANRALLALAVTAAMDR